MCHSLGGGGPWHAVLGWSLRTCWHGDPACKPESNPPSVCFLHMLALVVGKAPPSTTAGSQSPPETPVLTRSSSQTPTAGVTATTSTTSTVTAPAAAATGSPVKKQRPLLPKETAPAVQRVVWNSSSKFQTSSQKWHMQKMQRQQQQQQQNQQQQPQSSQGTRYQTRQAVKGTEPPPLLSVAPGPFLPHQQEKNNRCFIFSVPLGFLATVSWRPYTFHLALFLKIVLQLTFFTFLFPFFLFFFFHFINNSCICFPSKGVKKVEKMHKHRLS